MAHTPQSILPPRVRWRHLTLLMSIGVIIWPSYSAAELTTTVVSVTVSPLNVASANALCPAGTWAVSGGVQPGVSNIDVLIISSGPYFESGILFLQPDGEVGRATGWRGVVTNLGMSSQLVKIAVICAPWPVSATVGSINIVAGLLGGLFVTCPDGTIAVGGGSEPALQNMSTRTSNPWWDVGAVADLPAGDFFYDPPIGWEASSTNPNGSSQLIKVAALCMKASGAQTFYAQTRANPGQVTFGLGCIQTDELMITAGFEVLGSMDSRVLWTSPHVFFAGMGQTIFGVPDGTYTSVNFWTRSLLYSDAFADDARLAGVCVLPSPIFSDGFESGDTSIWSTTAP